MNGVPFCLFSTAHSHSGAPRNECPLQGFWGQMHWGKWRVTRRSISRSSQCDPQGLRDSPRGKLSYRVGCQGLPSPRAPAKACAAPAHPDAGCRLPGHLLLPGKKGKEPGRCQASHWVLLLRQRGLTWDASRTGALHVNERKSRKSERVGSQRPYSRLL